MSCPGNMPVKIKQFSPEILKLNTKHENNPFTLNCYMVPRSFLFIFHAGSRRLSSNIFRNSSYQVVEVVTQSSLSMFLLSASACVLYFRGIQKTESVILKASVISKLFIASSCNFSCYFLCSQLNYLQNYRCTSKQLRFLTFRGFQRVMNHC